MISERIIFSDNPAKEIDNALHRLGAKSVFIVYPEHTGPLLMPELRESELIRAAVNITIQDTEEAKTIETAMQIWRQLLQHGAKRDSVIVNLGGGITTDVGGFAAACYMRGIRYINIPTTLLACVDASIGGKTAVNLDGVKNIVGAFHQPEFTIISSRFFATLPEKQLLSGWGEMLKHALLTGPKATTHFLGLNPHEVAEREWLSLIEESIAVKARIVAEDPSEKDLRKVLNLGHTFGHALESFSHTEAYKGESLTHGHAVAMGLVTALVLSTMFCGFNSEHALSVATYVKRFYSVPFITCEHYDRLIELMRHDKKGDSQAAGIDFVVLSSPGKPIQSKTISIEDLKNAMDVSRDLLSI